VRGRAAATASGVLAVVLVLGACSKNTGQDDDDKANTDRKSTGSIATDPKDSLGPAPAVKGATKGGTFSVLRETAISHLDPQRIYSFAGLMNAQLYTRTLTAFKDEGKGDVTLVGDLATTPGKDVNKDCKVWEFTIKDGVKFEDGSPITSKEIAYGIARSFDPDLSGGPTYIQEWLADTPQYDTAWDFKANKTSLPPGLSTPDDKTLRFEFKKAHCDLPFAASLPYTAPLPPAKDTGIDLDKRPFSSGPYKFTTNTPGVEFSLDRNTNWDPKTDPIRHQYADKFVWSFGGTPDASANRVISDSGSDQAAFGWDGVPAALVSKVANDASLKARSLLSPTPSANRLSINVQRVKDLKVRQALNYAIDRTGFIKSLGGATVASPLTTLLPPGTLGYKKYDAYPAGASGDVAKAKELLNGTTPSLVLGVADTDTSTSTQLKANLERAGFKITVKTIPADSMLDEVGKKDNPWDLYVSNWAADWPSGAAILPVLYDGRTIKATNNSNVSYVNDDAVNTEFDRVLALSPEEQAKEWGTIDERIMKEDAPVVPLYVDVGYYVTGSKVGGIFIGSVFGYPSFVNAFVKQ
jgi:peptide/nickel transport system substrate-binding protein